jgi:hypothetical protein
MVDTRFGCFAEPYELIVIKCGTGKLPTEWPIASCFVLKAVRSNGCARKLVCNVKNAW